MKLYVARHGQTAWNAQGKILGRTDLDLTPEGERQARELARLVAPKGIGAVLTSPLMRARRTAAIVAEAAGAPLWVEERLIEQDYGAFEGLSRLDEGFLRAKGQFAYRYPGGESMMQVAHRVYALLDEIKARGAERGVLLLCHGGVMRLVRTYFEDMTNEQFVRYSAQNCCLEEYEL